LIQKFKADFTDAVTKACIQEGKVTKDTKKCLDEIDKATNESAGLLPEDATLSTSSTVRRAMFDYILSLPLEKQRKILSAFCQKEEKKPYTPFDIFPSSSSNAKILNKHFFYSKD
jgi:hypothetical protein